MTTISVSKLRQNLQAFLDRVAAGKRIRVDLAWSRHRRASVRLRPMNVLQGLRAVACAAAC